MNSAHVQALADTLSRHGIRFAFGVTGSGASMNLITALDAKGVTFIPAAHEAAAALMAGGCCRNGAANAVSITIKGPGFANAFPGLVSNAFECRPAVSVSEAYGASTPLFRRHKRLDHAALGRVIFKAYQRVGLDESAMGNVIALAASEIPGPVHFDLCPEPQSCDTVGLDAALAEGCSGLTAEVEALIGRSKRPALVLGSVVGRTLEQIDWASVCVPVATTAAAKGCMDERHPMSAGVITGEVKPLSPELAVLSQADLVIGIGLRNSEVVVPRPFGIPLVLIDSCGADQQDGFDATHELTNLNLSTAVEALLELIRDKRWGEDLLQARRIALEAAIPGTPWNVPRAFKVLNSALGDRPVLVLDTGYFCTVGEMYWQAHAPSAFCGSSIARYMGTALPTAIGVALSTPATPVICVIGDGGVRTYLPEIKLAVAERLKIAFVLMSDGRYGSVATAMKRGEGLSKAFTIASPSWWHTAAAMGCHARSVVSLEQLHTALCEWDDSEGPVFLELPFEPGPYAEFASILR